MKKLLFSLILGIFLISMVSAEIVIDSNEIAYDNPTPDTGNWGMKINVTRGMIQLISFNISSASAATNCYAKDIQNGSVYTGTLTNYICSFSTYPTFANKTTIWLYTYKSVSWQHHQKNVVGYPISSSNVQWVKGTYNNGGGDLDINSGFEVQAVWTEIIDTSPIVTLDVPLNNSLKINPILFNCSASDDRMINNISLFINGQINYTKNNGATNTANITLYRTLPIGSYNWTCRAYDNSTTLKNTWAGNYTFNLSSFIINNQIYNTTSYETKSENFILNITSIGGTIGNVKLFYNGTNYTATSNAIGSNYIFSHSLIVPLITNIGNKIWYYLWELNGTQYNSQSFNQNVDQTIFSLCNATISTKYLNLTFKDESNSLFINASIPSSTLVYYLGDGSINKTLSFINNSVNYEYDFCLYPNNKTLTSKTTIQYQSTDYPQRIYTDTLSLSNITTNKTLYLLSSTDGIYVTFQLINGNTEQVLSGVNVIGTRSIGGESTTVAIGTTDSAGSVTFWLNPDFEHTFNFSKSGYDTYTTTIYPTQTSYTISMVSGTTTTSIDYTKGISYTISPSGGAKIASLMNMTTYNFTYSLASDYWDVSQFGFSLYYGNNSLVGSVYANTNGGDIGLMANTLNSSNMIMKYYYVINSTYYNGTRTWFVERGAYEFSILHFFEDLTLYMDNGMFGIDDLARVFFCLLIITMVTGGVIMRYGIQNEAAIMGILFGLVYFLDIGIGLLPQVRFGNVAIEHFITIITALLLIGFLLKEESR